jgi:UDP-N-acetylmuramate dehydrogenase
VKIETDVPLAPRTTLGVGGPARAYAEARSEDDVAEALDRGVAFVLGGGSNLLVSDRGVDGLVLRVRIDDVIWGDDGRVDAGAGASWDALVEAAVARGLAGLECLSGIPGDVGATPIQNVGAYGQEVAETITGVVAVSRDSRKRTEIHSDECTFTYRGSVFKREARDRFVLTRVRFALRPGGAPKIAYAELAAKLPASATLAETRRTVRELRRGKSMLLDPTDENGRSAGSFFLNPIVAAAAADRLRAEAPAMPSWPAPGNLVKLAAGWLIERAGFRKGHGDGRVGLSTRHALAVVNRGGATAAEILAFAASVRRGVFERLGVLLQPEPELVGFAPDEVAPLVGPL